MRLRLIVRCLFRRLEANCALADPALNHLLQSYKGSAHNEQNVRGVHRSELLMRVLATALWRYIRNCTFQDLQQRLLYTLAGNIASDRGVLILAPDLVDLR